MSEASIRRHRLNHAEQSMEAMAESRETATAEGDEPVASEVAGGSDGRKEFTAIRDRPVTEMDVIEWLSHDGGDPSEWNYSFRSIAYGMNQFSNKMSAWPKVGKDGAPAWPVVQPAAPVQVQAQPPLTMPAREADMKLAIKCADTQIGFRALPDGTYEPFHDDKAMALFVEVCRIYQPDKITILGDFIDLPSQSRWAQEAGFARTTQMSLDRGHQFLAELRAACPNAKIILIEGNHDKRMQAFVEQNALAAFGLRRANMPESWPQMSLPALLRLDELDVAYIDAYPAATDWDNSFTRNIHGTRANSKGSTTSQYIHELGHIDTWVGHTHRLEITPRTLLGVNGETIRSYSANPGCLCRIDGAVPSTNGAVGADGKHAPIVENWQQGIGFLYYDDERSWPQVWPIHDGATLIDGRILSVS